MRRFPFTPVILILVAVIWFIACGSSNGNPFTPPPTSTLTSNFVFVRVGSGSAGNDSVVMMKNDGTGETVLVSQLSQVGSVQLSLDGKKGVSMEPDDNGHMQIYYVDMSNLQNLKPVQLTTSSDEHVMPQISPDNSTVLYHKWVSGDMAQAFTVRAAGGAETQISTPGTYVLFPAYTPDGKQIVFSTFDTNHTYQGISIMNADGTGIKTLTGVAGNNDGMPSVSPDGRTVVFYRYTFTPQGGTMDIYTIGVDGTNLKQLTTDGESLDPLYVKDKIVFVSHRDHNGAGEIYSMGLDGSNQKNLTNNGVDDYFFWD